MRQGWNLSLQLKLWIYRAHQSIFAKSAYYDIIALSCSNRISTVTRVKRRKNEKNNNSPIYHIDFHSKRIFPEQNTLERHGLAHI
jgi:hypothetical protein